MIFFRNSDGFYSFFSNVISAETGPYGAYLHIDKELSVGNDYRKEFVVSITN